MILYIGVLVQNASKISAVLERLDKCEWRMTTQLSGSNQCDKKLKTQEGLTKGTVM